jgi:hypothetical protein
VLEPLVVEAVDVVPVEGEVEGAPPVPTLPVDVPETVEVVALVLPVELVVVALVVVPLPVVLVVVVPREIVPVATLVAGVAVVLPPVDADVAAALVPASLDPPQPLSSANTDKDAPHTIQLFIIKYSSHIQEWSLCKCRRLLTQTVAVSRL